MDGLTRRDALTLLAAACLLGRVELAHGSTDAGYWAFADRCQNLLDGLWSPGDACYRSGGRGDSAHTVSGTSSVRGAVFGSRRQDRFRRQKT